MDFLKKIEEITKLNHIDCVFLYGSRAYNTFNSNSDYDFIVVASDATNGQQFNSSNLNITTYTFEHFQEKLLENKPFAIECFFLPNSNILKLKKKLIFKLKPNFEKEYQKKIDEDVKKLDDNKNNATKLIKIKFFIFKLQKQLEWLKNNISFSFDLKDEYEKIKTEIYSRPKF